MKNAVCLRQTRKLGTRDICALLELLTNRFRVSFFSPEMLDLSQDPNLPKQIQNTHHIWGKQNEKNETFVEGSVRVHKHVCPFSGYISKKRCGHWLPNNVWAIHLNQPVGINTESTGDIAITSYWCMHSVGDFTPRHQYGRVFIILCELLARGA